MKMWYTHTMAFYSAVRKNEKLMKIDRTEKHDVK